MRDARRSPRSSSARSDLAGMLLVHLEHEPARRARACASAIRRSVWPSSTSAARGSQSRTSGSSAVELARRRRTAGSRRRGRTGPSSAVEQVAVRRRSTSSPCARGVLARELERVRETVGRDDARVAALVLRARARSRRVPVPTSSDARRVDAVEQLEAALDDDLRLGTRHERARVGLAASGGGSPSRRARRRAARARRAAARARAPRALRLGQRPVVLRVELDPREAERPREQELGVEPRRCRRRAPRGSSVAPGEDLAERHRFERAALLVGRQRVGELVERRPASTWSRRCVVSLMRWSVTRFSGKL